MTAFLHDLSPGEAVLWDAMLTAGWPPAQCRMAFAAAARGVVVGERYVVTLQESSALSPMSLRTMRRDLLLRRLGMEVSRLASVTTAADPTLGTILEARLLVVPGLDVAVI